MSLSGIWAWLGWIGSWFELIRDALGMLRKLSSHSVLVRPADAAAVKKTNEASEKILAKGSFLGDNLKRASLIFEKRITAHYDELFTQIRGINGAGIDVVGHNGVEETGHRRSGMRTRRRTGRSGRSGGIAMTNHIPMSCQILRNGVTNVIIGRVYCIGRAEEEDLT